MANKRDIKRRINYACSELFAECVTVYLSVQQEDTNQVDAILTSVLKTHKEFVKRVSHPQPGMKPNKYYKVLIEDFNKQVCEIIDNINALS